MTQAQDAELRDQIVDSCRVVTRHIEGIIQDTMKIVSMPSYKSEAEDALNMTERVISLAQQAIVKAKLQMGEKQLEKAQT